jgi:ParB family chromosome partitioning protein
MVSEGAITAGHARGLLGTPDRAFQEALARRVVAEGLSVRTVEELVRERTDLEATAPSASGGTARPGRVPKLRQAGFQELEELLGEHLATRVKVQEGSGGGGKVVIAFADLDDLERLYRRMTEAVEPTDD